VVSFVIMTAAAACYLFWRSKTVRFFLSHGRLSYLFLETEISQSSRQSVSSIIIIIIIIQKLKKTVLMLQVSLLVIGDIHTQ
jgi:hypothetical protein